MKQHHYIEGFSKLDHQEKLKLISQSQNIEAKELDVLNQFKLKEEKLQSKLEEISENVVSNYMLPYSISSNFLINGKNYFIPMVTEESSVVAAASASAKFWFSKGGFKSKVHSKTKVGQVHFQWSGESSKLSMHFESLKQTLLKDTSYLLKNMQKRGGGITSFELLNLTEQLPDYYQLKVSFETADAMGANIINSVLEEMAQSLKQFIRTHFLNGEGDCEVIMAILSNHTPESLVECHVECDIDDLATISGRLSPMEFARKFKKAVDIANIDIYRATTHNKGIYNGIDAVVIATGNDFRAVESGGHSYAARDGKYKSLTRVEITDHKFKYILKVPMALGTVGGLTSIHPLAKLSLDILKNPSAKELMEITAAVGLANTFSAVKALITSGIQKGHMRFHLNNILNSLNADENEKAKVIDHFKNKKISYKSVNDFLNSLKSYSLK